MDVFWGYGKATPVCNGLSDFEGTAREDMEKMGVILSSV